MPPLAAEFSPDQASVNMTRFLDLMLFSSVAVFVSFFVSVSAGAATPGIVSEKPADGPFVKVADGYMVPYTFRVPGTDQEVEMIPVPGGEFLFGSPATEADRREDEGPQITVKVDPMWVAKTEVTWGL